MPESPVESVQCSHCRDGKSFQVHLGYFTECKVCLGRGAIIRNRLCACGGPIFFVSPDKLLFCGDKSCLKNLRAEVVEKALHPLQRYQALSNCTSFPGYGDREDE